MTIRLPFIIFTVVMLSYNVSAKDYTGIDVSHHQGKIIWKEVAKENIDFVYIKATGVTHFFGGVEGVMLIADSRACKSSCTRVSNWWIIS